MRVKQVVVHAKYQSVSSTGRDIAIYKVHTVLFRSERHLEEREQDIFQPIFPRKFVSFCVGGGAHFWTELYRHKQHI